MTLVLCALSRSAPSFFLHSPPPRSFCLSAGDVCSAVSLLSAMSIAEMAAALYPALLVAFADVQSRNPIIYNNISAS